MDFARHNARLRQPASGDANGTTVRTHLEAAAKRGVASAQRMLEDPPFPDALNGLWSQFQTLDRMRSFGMHGANPLSPADIAAANQLFDWRLLPHEVEAITALDAVTRFPGDADG